MKMILNARGTRELESAIAEELANKSKDKPEIAIADLIRSQREHETKKEQLDNDRPECG